MTNDFNSRRSGNFKPKLSPEEYAKAKQEEKEAVYNLIDTAISDIVNNPAEFQKYLDTQARMDRYSAANALLIYKQCPETTQLKDFNGWRDDNIRVKKGAKSISILEPVDYTKADGSTGISYNVKKAFDISQTNSRQQAAPAVSHDPRLLLKALINNAPCKISISENLPENVYAAYQPQDKVILIRQGMDAPDIFRALSQELAHAHMDRGEYNRADCAFTAYCVSYMLCKRNSIAVDTFRFDRLPEAFKEMDAQGIRAELGKIRDVANEISRDMAPVLEQRKAPSRDDGAR